MPHTPAPIRARSRGFTLAELVAILLIVGVLAAVALPRLQSISSTRDAAWRDQLVAGLRHASATAYSHRRLVCATVGSQNLTLQIASANPATACTTAIPGIDGGSGSGSDTATATAPSGAGNASLSPGGVLYFQPSGRVTTDGAGAASASRTIQISDLDPIVVIGETGHVR